MCNLAAASQNPTLCSFLDNIHINYNHPPSFSRKESTTQFTSTPQLGLRSNQFWDTQAYAGTNGQTTLPMWHDHTQPSFQLHHHLARARSKEKVIRNGAVPSLASPRATCTCSILNTMVPMTSFKADPGHSGAQPLWWILCSFHPLRTLQWPPKQVQA